MHQAWCKCWAVARPPVVPGGFCFTMSQLVEEFQRRHRRLTQHWKLRGTPCWPCRMSSGLGKGRLWVARHENTKVEHSNAIWDFRSVSFDLSWKSHHGKGECFTYFMEGFRLCTNEHLRTFRTMFHIWKEQVHACRLAAFVPHAKSFSISICRLHLLNICTTA